MPNETKMAIKPKKTKQRLFIKGLNDGLPLIKGGFGAMPAEEWLNLEEESQSGVKYTLKLEKEFNFDGKYTSDGCGHTFLKQEIFNEIEQRIKEIIGAIKNEEDYWEKILDEIEKEKQKECFPPSASPDKLEQSHEKWWQEFKELINKYRSLPKKERDRIRQKAADSIQYTYTRGKIGFGLQQAITRIIKEEDQQK